MNTVKAETIINIGDIATYFGNGHIWHGDMISDITVTQIIGVKDFSEKNVEKLVKEMCEHEGEIFIVYDKFRKQDVIEVVYKKEEKVDDLSFNPNLFDYDKMEQNDIDFLNKMSNEIIGKDIISNDNEIPEGFMKLEDAINDINLNPEKYPNLSMLIDDIEEE